jgi:hypothetical protein
MMWHSYGTLTLIATCIPPAHAAAQAAVGATGEGEASNQPIAADDAAAGERDAIDACPSPHIGAED